MSHSPSFRHFVRLFSKAIATETGAVSPEANADRHARHLSRRRFLQASAYAGAAGGLALGVPPKVWAAAKALGHSPRIAIIGAGLAGLNAAYQLQKAGVNATVYEASSRVGGRVLSSADTLAPGLIVELGAELINSNHFDMLSLVEAFELPLFNRIENADALAVPPVAYYFNGKQYSEADVADDLRPIALQIAKDAELLEQDYEQYAAPLDALSVTGYLNLHADKITKRYIRKLIEATIRTEFGVEPAQSSALQLIFNLPTVTGQEVEMLGNSDEIFTIKGGNSRLTKALANALQGQIQFNEVLTRLASSSSGYRLEFSSGEKVSADLVILALPFTALRKVDMQVTLPGTLKRFIQKGNLGANEKLLAGFNRRAWLQADGFGIEAWGDLGYSEVWDASQRQPERTDGALNFFLGGREAAKVYLNTALVGNRFIKRLDLYVPGLQEAASDKFQCTKWSSNPYSFGAYSTFKPGQLTEFSSYFWVESENEADRQEVVEGKLLFAGEHLSDEFFGFMNGAAQTGRLAAHAALRLLGQVPVVATEDERVGVV